VLNKGLLLIPITTIAAILVHVSVGAQEAPNLFDTINTTYKDNVKPIFQNKCFNCHSNQTRWPWYHSLPGIKQFLEYDVEEGREHLDLSDDFPFGGHGSPLEDLDAIEKSVNEGTMPPWQYKLMHWFSKFNNNEKEAILDWIRRSRNLISR